MPTVQRVTRKGRRPYYQIRHQGELIHLGSDPQDAYRRASELFAEDPITGNPTTVAELVDCWLRANPGQWRREMLLPFAAWCGEDRIADMTTETLAAYRDSLPNRPQTIRHKLAHARRALTWAASRGWVDSVPAMPPLPPVPKRPKDLPPGRLGAALGRIQSPNARDILTFITATGCRPGEARNLLWSQVDFARGVCELAAHKTAGHGYTRTIYLTPAAVAVLHARERKSAHVFLTRLGRPYTRAGLRSVLRRYGITPYQLRHTFAQAALEQVSAEDVAKLLGHSDLRMVGVYAQVRDQRARRVAASLTVPLPPHTAGAPVSHPPPTVQTSPAARTRTQRKRDTDHG